MHYAELEAILGDDERARAIFELAVNQPLLDMPEVQQGECSQLCATSPMWLICVRACLQVLWKAYIDFESELEEYDRVRTLYDRLLEKTSHVKVSEALCTDPT